MAASIRCIKSAPALGAIGAEASVLTAQELDMHFHLIHSDVGIVPLRDKPPHTVRGFVSILGSKGGQKIESSKSADGERTYKIAN
jgi:hypothetical protein